MRGVILGIDGNYLEVGWFSGVSSPRKSYEKVHGDRN